MNFHILAKKNFGPGVANSKFTTVRARTKHALLPQIFSPKDVFLDQFLCKVG